MDAQRNDQTNDKTNDTPNTNGLTPRAIARRFAVESGLSPGHPGTDRLAKAIAAPAERAPGFDDDDSNEWSPADGPQVVVRPAAVKTYLREQVKRIERRRLGGGR